MSAPSLEDLLAREHPKLLNCVHCGLCLEECPTYRLDGDETDSPRGRLALWRAEWEGRLEPGPESDRATDHCVGCLACESACPAKVPYGELLLARRAQQARRGAGPDPRVRILARLLLRPALFRALCAPLRLARRLGLRPHPSLPPGPAPVFEGTAAYARRVAQRLEPKKGEVALLTGCLTEGVFPEINAAAVRTLAVNGYRCSVPEGQGCCGAVAEHGGMEPEKALCDARNRSAFASATVVLTNASGCGLSLRRALGERQRDLADFLDALDLVPGAPGATDVRTWVDLPCHAVHGLGLKEPPRRLLQAAGLGGRWILAPEAERCCGAGGAYALTEPATARAVLEEKKALLGPLRAGDTLLTSNPVCLGQWSRIRGLKARHTVQALDESYRRAGLYRALEGA